MKLPRKGNNKEARIFQGAERRRHEEWTVIRRNGTFATPDIKQKQRKSNSLERSAERITFGEVNSFIATGDYNWLLQTAYIQMRRLIMSRLIWIYAVWQSVFQLYIKTTFQAIVCLKKRGRKMSSKNWHRKS